MKYKAAVFDMDGTILDTVTDLKLSLEYAFTKAGYPELSHITGEDTKSFFGSGARVAIQRAFSSKSITASETDISVVFREGEVKTVGTDIDKLMPPVSRFGGGNRAKKKQTIIEKLKAGGVGCAVVSNKPDKAVKILSEKYFPSLFNAAIGENEALGVRRKPAPDTTLLAADALDADINETVYIGDSEVDIETARNAGCDCICVTWGFRNKEYLENCGARHFASSADELFDLICCR